LTPEQRLREQIHEGVRATCPCCGYPTINGRAAYEICALCGWEDDGQDDAEHAAGPCRDPDAISGGPNYDYSLTEARMNFAAYFTMYRATDRDFEHERAQTNVKRSIAAAYDRCVDGDVTFAEADAEAHALLDDLS
jgi:Cysteine-rich CPCC